MSRAVYERIRNDPKFQALNARRRRLTLGLSAVVLVTYYGFMMVVAFAPKILATPVAEGATTTVGVPIGAGMVVLFWLLTGLYVWKANREYDALNEAIVRDGAAEVR